MVKESRGQARQEGNYIDGGALEDEIARANGKKGASGM